MDFRNIADSSGNQVFHSNKWTITFDDEHIDELISQAKKNSKRKARFCLHPDPESQMQVTYLAFVSPYQDEIHSHPNRPEVLIPVRGEAEARTFDGGGNLIKSETMLGNSGNAFSSSPGTWHSIFVKSDVFVMIEIGLGPFTKDSTVLLNK